jgi:hypothetical protein
MLSWGTNSNTDTNQGQFLGQGDGFVGLKDYALPNPCPVAGQKAPPGVTGP